MKTTTDENSMCRVDWLSFMINATYCRMFTINVENAGRLQITIEENWKLTDSSPLSQETQRTPSGLSSGRGVFLTLPWRRPL